MSENLFLDPTNELQRMEAVVRAKCKSYSIAVHEQLTGPANGHAGQLFYFANVVFTLRSGKPGTFSVDGESFPDLYAKIADKLQTL